tara:strand:+ start:324 stop:551 length:228 start_codon:yes stop_codon:yes gene_type:complete
VGSPTQRNWHATTDKMRIGWVALAMRFIWMVLQALGKLFQLLATLKTHSFGEPHKTPTVGLEPTTTRLRALRSAD